MQLAEQPCVLDGDGRLVGESLHQGDLALGERPDLVSHDIDRAEQLVRPEHGNRNHGAEGTYLPRAKGVLGIGADIVDMDRAPLERDTPRAASTSCEDGIRLLERPQVRRQVVGGHEPHHLAVEPKDQRVLGFAQPDRVLGQRFEHWLQVEGGPPDHLEQLAGRRLLLEGHPQLAVARLQLFEQADILDGDHGLVGEGPEHLDVAGGERSRLAPLDDDGADRATIRSEHRHGEKASPTAGSRHILLILRVFSHVADLGDGTSKDRPPRDLRAARAHRVRAPQDLEHLGGDVVRRQMQLLAIEPMQDTEACVAQLLGASDDRIEHRLDVGRRAADDPQDVGCRGLLLQGLGQVGVLGLQLREQSRVLDGDDGLVGEGGHEVDLLVGERAGFGPVDEEHADQVVLPQHRDG